MAADYIKMKLVMDPGKQFRGWLRRGQSVLKRWAANGVGDAGLDALQRHHAAIFASGGATGLSGRPSGVGAWSAWKARTLRARMSRRKVSRIAPGDYGATPSDTALILVWSGRLRDSLTKNGDRFGDAIRGKTNTSIRFGTKTPTAFFHTKGRKNMAARPMLDDVVGPDIAIEIMGKRLLALLDSDMSKPTPSPGMIPSAAGFYVRQ